MPVVPVVPLAPIAAAVVRRERRIVEQFVAAGATSAERATTAAALGIEQGHAFRLLLGHGVLQSAGPDRLFVDLARWRAHRRKRLRTGLTCAAIALVVVAGILVWAARR